MLCFAQQTVEVRFLADTPFTIVVPLPTGGVRNLSRERAEPLGSTLVRLRTTLPSLRVDLLDCVGEVVDEATANEHAWLPGHALRLGNESLPLVVNAPRVAELSLAGGAFVGLPLVAATSLEHCSREDLAWRWERDGHVVSSQPLYVPTTADVGVPLLVRCSPRTDGEPELARGASARTGPVRPAPHRPDATARAAALGPRQPGTARVATFNVLADAYAHTWGLLYPYLAKELKPPEYRLPLALADVLAADADVVCLQEVDLRFFHKFWVPQLDAAGYDGRHTAKLGASGEGIALFVRRAAFTVEAFQELDLRAATGLPEGWLEEQQGLADSLSRVTTVGQLALLRPAAHHGFTQPLLVANAHLFFHPRAGHVRILQLHTLLRAAAALAGGEERPPALLLCGDLNAEPQDGPVRYLTSGCLSAKDAEWAAGAAFRFERALRAGPEAVASLAAAQAALPDPAEPPSDDLGFVAAPMGCGVTLRHPFCLVPGCGEPPFTNFVGGFHATLDHVLVDAARLRVLRSMPPPPLAAVTVSTALPNAQFTSDHLLQACDVAAL